MEAQPGRIRLGFCRRRRRVRSLALLVSPKIALFSGGLEYFKCSFISSKQGAIHDESTTTSHAEASSERSPAAVRVDLAETINNSRIFWSCEIIRLQVRLNNVDRIAHQPRHDTADSLRIGGSKPIPI